MSKSSTDLLDWLTTASDADFVGRITTDPGMLERRDIGPDGFSLLHQAAAMGRQGVIASILERGVAVNLPSGAPEEFSDSVDGPPRFDPGYTPLMAAAAYGQVAAVTQLLAAGAAR